MMQKETVAVDRIEMPAAEPGAKRSQPRGRVIVFSKWCKQCGLCVAFCPRHVLGQAEDGSVVVVNPDECTACSWCELHCPDFAITVRRIDESTGV
jgi:2-oxoglutarate ferredoxin oxidoreductase subunit delta